MLAAEHSYFDFLMRRAVDRRANCIPFARAVGVMPEIAHMRRSRRLPAAWTSCR